MLESLIANLPTAVEFVFFGYLVVVYLYECLDRPGGFWLLSLSATALWGITYIVHEAGHIYWSFDGEVVRIFGGTLNELLFTMGIGTIAMLRGYPRSAALFLLWFSYATVGISKYIADARTQKLPIPGGGLHDWHWLLSNANLLEYDQTLSRIAFVLGALVVPCALALLYLGYRSDLDTAPSSDNLSTSG